MANLKELSERLGLSQTTVSRALNGYPEVSEETRQRVVKAAADYDYQPNVNARKLATGKSRTIGHVVPLGEHEMINPHFSDFIAGAGAVYNQNGYDMLLKVVTSENELGAYRDLKNGNRIDGVIVHGPMTNDRRPDLLTELGVPFVVHGRLMERTDGYAWVDVNNANTFNLATQHLLDLGHKRIALLNGLESMCFAVRRREGFTAAMVNAGLSPDEKLMHSMEMTEPNGYEAMRALFRTDLPPTAVLCSSSVLALGASRAIRDMGLQVGKDVSLMTFDDCLSFLGNGQAHGFATTAMRSSLRQAGEICARLLLDIIGGKKVDTQIIMDADFADGATTGPAPDLTS